MMMSGYNLKDLIQEAQYRWLRPGEVFFILQNHEETQLNHEPPQKPPSGSVFLFNKRVLRFFRKDGHSWRRKKDGKNVGEAHERLKVGNVEALSCYYAHGEQNPNFQRRSYWMLDPTMEHIVLVHYRDITIGKHSAGPISTLMMGSSNIVQGSNSHTTQLTSSTSTASGYYEPYNNTTTTSYPSSLEVSPNVITSNGTNHFNPTQTTDDIDSSPEFQIDQALRKLEEQLSLDRLKDIGSFEYPNELGFTVNDQDGLQYGLDNYMSLPKDEFTVIPTQQSLHWKDVQKYDAYGYPSDINEVLLPRPITDNDASNDSSRLASQQIEDSTFPTYTPARNIYQSDADLFSALFEQGQIGTPIASDSSLTIAQEQKFSIREISPDWGYANEPTKVLIVGSFTCDPSNNEWICMFGDTEVPVEIIQEGVICCRAPPHSPGKVTICITCGNREACSEVREFEYRDKPKMHVHTNSTESEESSGSSDELLLLVKFVQLLLLDKIGQNGKTTKTDLTSSMATEDSWGQVIEAVLHGSLAPLRTTDWLLEELLKDKFQRWISDKFQDENALPTLSKKEQGIIYMVSGLGFEWALTPVLKTGVGVNFRDSNGWTALHWAARFGREKIIAELLAAGANAGAVTDPCQQDPIGKTPASIAAKYGHKGLAGYLSEMALTSHLSSLTLKESELSKGSADLEAERTVNSISEVEGKDEVSLKHTLAAVRNAAQAAARIQAAFRAHSFKKRKQKEAAEACNGIGGEDDEYGLEVEGLAEASKAVFGNARHHHAALSIQKKYRGWKGRKDFLALRHKVVKIQAHVRGYQARKNYETICWAVGVVEKIVLRWYRKGVGLRGFHLDANIGEEEDGDINKLFRKQKVDAALSEAVSRVLSMVSSQPARQQYQRMLHKYRLAKAQRGGLENEGASTSEAGRMEADVLNEFM